MLKKILKTLYLFSLFNIIKAADAPVQIEAKKITIIDLLTNEEFKTTDTSNIELGAKGVNYDNIKDKFGLFKHNGTKDLDEKQKNYEVMLIINDGNEIKDKKVNPTEKLDIYISPKTSIPNNQICIKINNKEYKNEEIKNFINIANKDIFENLKNNPNIETEIIKLLNLENIKNGDKSIKSILTDEGKIKEYYINKLDCVNDEPKFHKKIDEDAINDFKKSILSNGSINIKLKLLKNPINLKYNEINIKEDVKELLEGIKNGKTDIKSNCKAIIEALKDIHNDDTYKIKSKAEAKLNDDTNEITDKTVYEIELSKKCYEIEITAKFNITSKDKNASDFKFINTDIFEKGNTIKFKVDKGTNLIKIKEMLNDKFNLKNIFENSKIIYKDGTKTIDNETSFDINSTIDIDIDTEFDDLVIGKDSVFVNLQIENNIADRDFKSFFTKGYPHIILKDNSYNTLLNEIKKILGTDDISKFKIYKDNDEFTKGKTLNKENINYIIVKIIKVIDNIYKDIDKDHYNDNDNNNDNQNTNGDETDKKNNKKRYSNYPKKTD